MKTTTFVVLLTLFTLSCTNAGGAAGDAESDTVAGEPAREAVPDESSVIPDMAESDGMLEMDLRPDIDPSSIDPGDSCLHVDPPEVSFGGVKVGTLKEIPVTLAACGDAPLRIDEFHLADESSPGFILAPIESAPTPEQPVLLLPGEELVVAVGFRMDTHSAISEDGEYIPEMGELIIDSTAIPAKTVVPLTGAAVEINCPTAIIKCQEVDHVQPGTVLHLFGDESYASEGAIQKWEWSVDQPLGSQSVFVPSYTFPNPTFEANMQGVYTFSLRVWNPDNTPSCLPAKYEVPVFPYQAIRVELTWDVPGRDVGIVPRQLADLDLHFAHPWAAGPDLDGDGEPDGWYDIPFDCFWFNPHPNWGSYDPSPHDDPELEEHDDGETVVLEVPEKVTYKVGVHYFQQSGTPASATVRVLVYNEVVYESPEVELNPLDLWDALTIEWPTGKVKLTKDGGDWKITPKYQNPYFAPN